MLTIRWACEADCALIRRLADEVFPATYRGIITPSQMEYMMEWMYGAEVLAREMCGEFAWFIASADGEPCGYLWCSTRPKTFSICRKSMSFPASRESAPGNSCSAMPWNISVRCILRLAAWS